MSFIYVPFSYLMKGCLYISGNSYLFALFFFALVMEIILLPLAIKQQKSSIMMAKIKPKEMAIREKYKGRTDRVTQQKMTMEIQNMYQESGYNQFGGCLPLLIQIPIIFILFAIVRNPITYASELPENFVSDKSEIAVEYYQDQKEALIKDAFETESDYNNYISQIEKYQTNLGVAADPETSDAGYKLYEYDKEKAVSGENEIALSRLIIDGREEIESLIEEGKLDSSFLTVYEQTGLESFKDQLPNYRIGPLNLINEPDFGTNLWLMIVPVLVFLTSFLSTKIVRKVSGSANQTDANGNPVGGGLFMEVGMPLMSAMIAYSMPAAIGAYWIWRTLIGIVKSVVMAFAMPIPKVTEEDIIAARKEMKSKQKKKKVITIEVDEDDTSYDDLVVRRSDSGETTRTIDPTTRTPRRIEMLTADDEDDNSDSGKDGE